AKRTLKLNLEEILNYFDNKTTNAFTEGVHTKVKLLKRISFGLRNPQVYVEKLELGFVKPKMLISTHTY
nr:transposase [Patescibacteria group bacterium]